MKCTIYCTAEGYHLKSIAKNFQAYNPQIHQNDVLSINAYKGGDIFFTFFGCIIFWNISVQDQAHVIEMIRPHERERMTSVEFEELGLEISATFKQTSLDSNVIKLPHKNHKTLLALSYALAQSTKLSCFERALDLLINETKNVPKELAEMGKTRMPLKEISKKMGKIFLVSSSMNLNSDILDTPQILWEGDHSQIEAYQKAREEMEIEQRTNIMNQRLVVVQEMYSVLSNDLHQARSTRLEFAIVLLISVEIILAFIRII
ncbi:MAG: RMD1 family protein [Alphaproteobacteria bacterium]|nr:RMD1 family protein [Alphaproteobacteria bacterium]